jgi:hypothetical protein
MTHRLSEIFGAARRDLVWSSAYGAAVASELRRLGHGSERGRWTTDGPEGEARYSTEIVDATDEAHAWAKICADAAAKKCEEP